MSLRLTWAFAPALFVAACTLPAALDGVVVVQPLAAEPTGVCGDAVVDLTEECDGAPTCDAACRFDDGVLREGDADNDEPFASGVLVLPLDAPVRGTIDADDVDWWRIELGGDHAPGALRVVQAGADTASIACGNAADVVVEVFDAAGEAVGVMASARPGACHEVQVTTIDGDLLFGNETLWMRVRSSDGPATYRLEATYAESNCGDGRVDVAEECEPSTNPDARRCDPQTCRFSAVPNDGCAQAVALELDENGATQQHHQTLEGAHDDRAFACGDRMADGTPDVFFRLHPPRAGRVRLTLKAPNFSGAFTVTPDCTALTGEGTCQVVDSSPGSIDFDVEAGRDVVVALDALSGSGGPFDLYTRYIDAVPPNAVCADAIDLSTALATGETVHVVGDLSNAPVRPKAELLCWGAVFDRPEVYYRLRAPRDGRIEVAITNAGLRTNVSLARSGCTTDVRCEGRSEYYFVADMHAGEEALLVVAPQFTDVGPFALDVRFGGPPTNDACANAEAVELPDDGTPRTVRGTTWLATDDLASAVYACRVPGERGGDVFYALQASTPGLFALTTSGDTHLSIVAAPTCAGVVDGACFPDGNSTPLYVGREPLIIAVDALHGRGDFALTARRIDSADGETCETAVSLAGAAGALDGTTRGRYDSYNAQTAKRCGYNVGDGPDVVHRLELEAGESADLSLVYSGAGSRRLAVLDACPVSAARQCLGPRAGSDGGVTAHVVNDSGSARSYFVVVDATLPDDRSEASGGPYHLEWSVHR